VHVSTLDIYALLKLAHTPSENRALTKFNISDNTLREEGTKALAEALQGNQIMTELNISSNQMFWNDISGVAALTDVVRGMGAILSVNLLKNGIGVKQAQALASILKEHPTLKSLCGNKGDETELDMSGKMKGAGDAIMLAAEIIDKRAFFRSLTSLDISDNKLAQGAYKGSGNRYNDTNYATDTTGMFLIATKFFFSDARGFPMLFFYPL
jgi:hypothetical protein